MTQDQREIIEKNLKPNQIAVDTASNVIGEDENGYPVFETVLKNIPKEYVNNYKLIKNIEPYNGAVIEMANIPQEPTNEPTS